MSVSLLLSVRCYLPVAGKTGKRGESRGLSKVRLEVRSCIEMRMEPREIRWRALKKQLEKSRAQRKLLTL